MVDFYSYFQFKFLGISFDLKGSIIEEWVIMLCIAAVVLWVTHRMETVPKGKQVWAELIVDTINGVVKGTMGESFTDFAPYIGTLMIFLLVMNILGLTGFEPPTTDYSIALSFALVSFVVIQVTTMKRNGILHYFTGFAKPMVPITPLNIIERIVVPVSLSLRLFGNIFAAALLMELIHNGLEFVSKTIHLAINIGGVHFGLLQIAIPLPFNMYFDIFDGFIQMIIFSMLTMIFVKTTVEH